MHGKIGKSMAGLGGGLGAAGGLLGAGSGLLAMAGPIGAAGLALGAFGAVAVPVIKKVTTAQTALTAAQAQYTKAVTGPAQQAALANAQASVAQAQAGVAAAKTASAHASALTALANAQRHYQQLASNPAAQNALKAEAAATKGLNGSQMQMMGTLNQLKGVFTGVENALSPLIESVLKLGVTTLKDLMPPLTILAKAGGQVVMDFLKPLNSFLQMTAVVGFSAGSGLGRLTDHVLRGLTPFGEFIKQVGVFAQQVGPLLGKFLVQLLAVFMQLFVQTMPAGLKMLKLFLPALIQMLTQMIPVIAVTAKIVAVGMQWLAANKLLVPALWLLIAAFVALKVSLLTNPIFLIGAAIITLWFIVNKYHKQIWDFITRVWGDIFKFFKHVWDDIKNVFLNGVKFIVDLWLTQAGMIVHAAAFAFGWIPGIGGKLKEAAKAFDRFRDNVNKSIDGLKSHTVNVGVAMTASSNPYPGRISGRAAAGTSGAAPGWGWVGEEGPELVNMQGGETVVPNGQSMRMTRGYAQGVGVHASLPTMAFIQGAISHAVAAIAAAFARSIGSIGNIGGSGVARWAPVILRVLGMLGQDSSNLGPVEHRMNQESGGNPRAINLWDINAQRGDSRGLMQVIGSTFAAYRSF